VRDILKLVVRDRELNLLTLNRYRYSEQRSCKDLTDLIETLDGKPRELVRDLSHHIADEAPCHVADLWWIWEPTLATRRIFVYEFDRLVDREYFDPKRNLEDGMIAALAAINVTEKGCEYFSAHIHALKLPKRRENIKIRETIERILPEEAGHVRWGTAYWQNSPAQNTNKSRAGEAEIRGN